MEIDGWAVSSDARQFITAKDGKQYYHMNLENALYDICERIERQQLKAELGSVIQEIKKLKARLYQDLKAIPTGVYRSNPRAMAELVL